MKTLFAGVSTAVNPLGKQVEKNKLPDWLHNALPYVYLCAGLFAMIMLRNWDAVLSGVALISAGSMAWMRLRQSRPESAQIRSSPESRKAVTNAAGSGLAQISWKTSYECGHPVIDARHRRSFGIGTELIDAVLSKEPEADADLLLDELVSHINDH